eukprot:m.249473 g.249473  ORF g.249473 m.249473 type:complete len:514 (-) comp19524_c0_seq3:162-1703(-)
MPNRREVAKKDSQMRCAAIIGAGPAGLAAARRLAAVGVRCTILEADGGVGGCWRHGGHDVHRVIWPTLKTNLPKEIMAFHDVPFVAQDDVNDDTDVHASVERAQHSTTHVSSTEATELSRKDVDSTAFARVVEGRSFVNAAAIDHYLQRFFENHIQDHQNITTLTHSRVTSVKLATSTAMNDPVGSDWIVEWQDRDVTSAKDGGVHRSGVFDLVVVANGHYNDPVLPAFEGQDTFPGRIMHSKDFVAANVFDGKRVVVVGVKASGTDIARELAGHGADVHCVDRLCECSHQNPAENAGGANGGIWRRPSITRLNADGSVVFQDKTHVDRVDTILLCTGYHYTFPFLSRDILSVCDRRVHPLYMQLFHCEFPSLVFIGIPWTIIPFPLFDIQATFVARVASGKVALPSYADRKSHLEMQYERCANVKDTHKLAGAQFDYARELAAAGAFLDTDLDARLRIVEQVYAHVGTQRPKFPGDPDVYRENNYRISPDNTTWTFHSAVDGSTQTHRVHAP